MDQLRTGAVASDDAGSGGIWYDWHKSSAMFEAGGEPRKRAR